MYYKIQNVYYFGWNILLTGGVYLMVDTYNYFIILTVNEVIYTV